MKVLNLVHIVSVQAHTHYRRCNRFIIDYQTFLTPDMFLTRTRLKLNNVCNCEEFSPFTFICDKVKHQQKDFFKTWQPHKKKKRFIIDL